MMESPSLRISVVVPTYGRRASLERLLKALARQTLPVDTYEVIVSVDGSQDGTADMLRGFQAPYRLRPLWQPNRGRAAACNRGIGCADGDVIVLLDDDMEPESRLLESHLRMHPPGSRVGVMGAAPIMVDDSSPPITRYLAAKFNRHLDRLARSGQPLVLRDFYSGNFSVPRDALSAIGGFDEAFSIYGNEDLELSIRLRGAGIHLIYSAEAAARQHKTKSFAQVADDCVAKGRTAVLLAGKHPSAVPDLRLAAYRRVSLERRLLRASMLSIGSGWSGTPRAVVGTVQWLERIRAPLLNAAYTLALDYFYWTGVFAALRENRRTRRGLTALPKAG